MTAWQCYAAKNSRKHNPVVTSDFYSYILLKYWTLRTNVGRILFLNVAFGFTLWVDRDVCWGLGGVTDRGQTLTSRSLRLRTSPSYHELTLQSKFDELHTQRLESRNDERRLNALRVLPVCPVFEDEKSRVIRKKVKQNIALKFHIY